jgi:hypothetical protein
MREFDKEFLDKINKASNIISLKSRSAGASWIVVSAAVAASIFSINKDNKISKISKILKNIKEDDRCKNI